MLTKGKYAKAQCPICGLDKKYTDLRKDWRGAWVCKDCVDMKPFHPTPKPDPREGRLCHPAPLVDVMPPLNPDPGIFPPERSTQ